MIMMHIGKNIAIYRKKNHLTQEELAKKLSITRQSVSKWENEETLPSIDNLVTLSGLLDISLDELITGEAYLHFPLEYGVIQHRKLLYLFLLSPTFIAILIALNAFTNFSENYFYLAIALLMQILLYSVFVYLFPLKKSRLYTHWTLTKKGIDVPIYKMNFWTELWLPIKELINRQTKFISFDEIEYLSLEINAFRIDPNVGVGFNGYFVRNISIMNEAFELAIMTKQGDTYKLDLTGYYFTDTKDRQLLYSILLFLKRKQIPIHDPHHVLPLIKERKSVVDTLYV